ncbi:MAG: oleate hydratase [Tannerellaceae bacterium]|nr:oleate hydratase [Tannerellaceae bacterium]
MLRGDNSERYGWLVGIQTATLPAALFMIRDGKMKGENIHIFEKNLKPGQETELIKQDAIWKETINDYAAYETLLDVLERIPSAVDPKRSAKEELIYFNQQLDVVTKKGWKRGEQTILNQYNTTLMAIRYWLRDQGVVFRPDTKVLKLGWEKYVDTQEGVINTITYVQDHNEEQVEVGFEDLVIVTDGYDTEIPPQKYHNFAFLNMSVHDMVKLETVFEEMKKVTNDFLGLKE